MSAVTKLWTEKLTASGIELTKVTVADPLTLGQGGARP